MTPPTPDRPAQTRPAQTRHGSGGRDPQPVVVVLGAGPGIGASVAQAFGTAGCRVALVARDAQRLATMVSDLEAVSIAALAVPADLSDPKTITSALDEVTQTWGTPDVLVYNPSVYVPGTPTTTDVAAVEQGLRVGALGALVALQAVAPGMRARGSGLVITTGGGTALAPWVDAIGLSMQKAALRNLSLGATSELAGTGVRVTTCTISGLVGSPGLEPDAIAARYVELWQSDDAVPEIVMRTAPTASDT